MLNIFGIVKLNLSNGMIYIYHSLGKKCNKPWIILSNIEGVDKYLCIWKNFVLIM